MSNEINLFETSAKYDVQKLTRANLYTILLYLFNRSGIKSQGTIWNGKASEKRNWNNMVVHRCFISLKCNCFKVNYITTNLFLWACLFEKESSRLRVESRFFRLYGLCPCFQYHLNCIWNFVSSPFSIFWTIWNTEVTLGCKNTSFAAF